jgi:hypothetical protein
MQHKTYPLPPLLLSEVIDKCRDQHEYKGDDRYESERSREYMRESACDIEPFVVEIKEGHGRHECDPVDDVNGCQWCTRERRDEFGNWVEERVRKDDYAGGCYLECDDSDWVVTLQYSTRGWQAIYGIKRHGDVQDVSLWAD